jgi:phage-related protein
MPKRETRLEFYSDDLIPVEISGYVESVETNLFSKDPELLVSILCPDPYFTSIDPIVVTGQTIRAGGVATVVEYNGTIEAGIKTRVTSVGLPDPTEIGIQIGDPKITYFEVNASVTETMFFETSSEPMRKYVQNVDLVTGLITNLLNKVTVQEGSAWPILQPGENEFSVVTDQGVQDWELRYFERFGGL